MSTQTAAQRRAEAKNDYNAFLDVCPSRELVARISGKWVTLVLCALGGGPEGGGSEGRDPAPMRFSELSRHIAGVSQKMLTQTLRSLEQDGLITRTVTPTVPVTVSYELTELGLSLRRLVSGIKAWAETHMDDVLAHRSEAQLLADAGAGQR